MINREIDAPNLKLDNDQVLRDCANQLNSKANVDHTHPINEIAKLDESLAAIESSIDDHQSSINDHQSSINAHQSSIQDLQTNKANVGHVHATYEIAKLDETLDAIESSVNDHTASVQALNAALDGKADKDHSHGIVKFNNGGAIIAGGWEDAFDFNSPNGAAYQEWRFNVGRRQWIVDNQ